MRKILQFDSARLKKIEAQLAGRLALLNRDLDATTFLSGSAVDRAILAHIAVGQARRIDFGAAFSTLERLRSFSVPPGKDNVNDPGPVTAIVSIERIAARVGNLDAFERADSLRRQINGPSLKRWAILLPPNGWLSKPETWVLVDLARAGYGKVAIEYALATEDLTDKIESLCTIAEGLNGVSEPPLNSFSKFDFFERW